MTTDSQRRLVYDTEQILRQMYDNAVQAHNPEVDLGGIRLTLPPEAKFGSVESVQAYVDRVTQMPSVTAAFGDRGRVKVRKRKGAKAAHYERSSNTIAVHDGRDNWAMRELVVLHELAHHYALVTGHGPKFVQTYIELLGLVMGPEVGLAMRILADDNGVDTKVEEKEVA